MKLTTLEQSKLLKHWGAPQDTTYCYLWDEDDTENIYETKRVTISGKHLIIAAYDLESLIEWLHTETWFEISLEYAQVDEYEEGERVFQWIAEVGNEGGEGDSMLEAVFNLAEAINGGTK